MDLPRILKFQIIITIYIMFFLLMAPSISAQFILMEEGSELLDEKSFNRINRSSENNKLAKFLKENLTPKDLVSIKFDTKPNFINSIRAKFEVDEEGNPWNFRIYTGTPELNRKVESLLTTFLTKNIPNLKRLRGGIHYMQLFSRENGKVRIKPSSAIVSDFPPVIFQECSDNAYFNSYNCFEDYLKKLITNSISNEVLVKEEIYGELRAHVSFKIEKTGRIKNLIVDVYSPNIYRNGKIFDLKVTSYSNAIEKEVKRILEIFSTTKLVPANRNGIPYDVEIKKTISIYINEYISDETKNKLTNNEITKRLKNEISDKIIKQESFLNEVPTIKIFYNYEDSGRLNNIWTNAFNSNLNKKLIKTYKKIIDEDKDNSNKSHKKLYYHSLLRKYGDEKLILADPKSNWISSGIYKECSSCTSFEEYLKENLKKITFDIAKKFDSLNLAYRLSIPDKIHLGGGLTRNLSKGDDSAYSKSGKDSYYFFRQDPLSGIISLGVSDKSYVETKIKPAFYNKLTQPMIIESASSTYGRKDDLYVKLVVDEFGKIKIKGDIKVRDYYNKTTNSKILEESVNKITKAIRSIIKELPEFKEKPMLNGKEKSMEIGIVSFFLNKVEKL